jgi:hypothetical protein
MIVWHHDLADRPENIDDSQLGRTVDRMNTTPTELSEFFDYRRRVGHRACNNGSDIEGGAITLESSAAISDELLRVKHDGGTSFSRTYH